MSDAEKAVLFVELPGELMSRLDDFRFTHRFPSRAEAVRWLLSWALDQQPEPQQERDK